MDILSLVLIAVGLAMDAFAVSICKGLAMKRPGMRSILIIGMIREALAGDEEDVDDDIGVRTMLLLAIATSIDALAVGISLAMTGDDILTSAVLIGVITFLISSFGVKIGSLFGDRFGKKAELLGGVILIVIGLRILLEHLGVF